MTSVFTLSIEPTEGQSFVHGCHLGTIEHVARFCAEEIFHCRTRFAGRVGPVTIRTVALMRDGQMVDCFDGEWASDLYEADMAAMEDARADAEAAAYEREQDYYGMAAERARHP